MIVLIPMAGHGVRFAQKGYKLPKPLIDVNGEPMITKVLNNIGIEASYVFIIQAKHAKQLIPILKQFQQDAVIIEIDGVTEGAACTCLLAEEHINNDDDLLIANCDQLMNWNKKEFFDLIGQGIDGCIFTFTSTAPNNSYCRLDDTGYVSQVAEKQVISDIANCGVFHFSKGRFFVEAAKQMIASNKRTNGEFFVSPVYSEMLENGYRIKTLSIQQHFPIGTPEELEKYLGTVSN